jgi:hypothetical protein
VGEGNTWDVIAQLFDTAYRKHGFQHIPETPIPSTFRRPGLSQLSLFDAPPS